MNKRGKNTGFTKRVSNEEFELRAQKVIDTEVRSQVEVYEKLQKTETCSSELVLSPAQKAHVTCHGLR